MLEAKGWNGQLELEGDTIRIRRKGVVGFLSQGLSGVKELNVSNLTSI